MRTASAATLGHQLGGHAGGPDQLGALAGVELDVVDHLAHGDVGDEGKSPVGRPGPVTPWGKPALGYKTRKTKNRTDKFIVKRLDQRNVGGPVGVVLEIDDRGLALFAALEVDDGTSWPPPA